ncbi:hypothetical protein GCM10010360_60880 [Streptomyces nogalater]
MVVRAALLLGGLEAFLNSPAAARDAYEFVQCGVGRSVGAEWDELSETGTAYHRFPGKAARPCGAARDADVFPQVAGKDWKVVNRSPETDV